MVDKGNVDKHRTGITGNGLKGLSKVVETQSGARAPLGPGMVSSTLRPRPRRIPRGRSSSRTSP